MFARQLRVTPNHKPTSTKLNIFFLVLRIVLTINSRQKMFHRLLELLTRKGGAMWKCHYVKEQSLCPAQSQTNKPRSAALVGARDAQVRNSVNTWVISRIIR